MLHKITNRYSEEVIGQVEADSFMLAVQKAARELKIDLSYANLSYANLSYANLRGANLSYANLRGANLSYANLRGANLRGAKIDNFTLRGELLQLTNIAEWGLAMFYVTIDNDMRMFIGRRHFNMQEALEHWKDREDRPMTRVALAMAQLWFDALPKNI